ncbi:hypothetical protein IT397_02805 [Candidatus Nomurabacteria bacterium]|nr:hypothetical protein [Candidatus Nomurabacteria bacterium]
MKMKNNFKNESSSNELFSKPGLIIYGGVVFAILIFGEFKDFINISISVLIGYISIKLADEKLNTFNKKKVNKAIWVGIILILLFVLANTGGIVLARVFVTIYLGLFIYSLFRKLL